MVTVMGVRVVVVLVTCDGNSASEAAGEIALACERDRETETETETETERAQAKETVKGKGQQKNKRKRERELQSIRCTHLARAHLTGAPSVEPQRIAIRLCVPEQQKREGGGGKEGKERESEPQARVLSISASVSLVFLDVPPCRLPETMGNGGCVLQTACSALSGGGERSSFSLCLFLSLCLFRSLPLFLSLPLLRPRPLPISLPPSAASSIAVRHEFSV